jgi:hypothetical protein
MEEIKDKDFTRKEYFSRWKVLLGVIGSMALLCWWNSRATYLILPANGKMFFITITSGAIFWGMFWYIKFNWNQPLSLSHLQPKKAIGLFLALLLGIIYAKIIYYSFTEEFAKMPLNLIPSRGRISSYIPQTSQIQIQHSSLENTVISIRKDAKNIIQGSGISLFFNGAGSILMKASNITFSSSSAS